MGLEGVTFHASQAALLVEQGENIYPWWLCAQDTPDRMVLDV
jgi:hypothetical protein